MGLLVPSLDIPPTLFHLSRTLRGLELRTLEGLKVRTLRNVAVSRTVVNVRFYDVGKTFLNGIASSNSLPFLDDPS